ncbi:MAG TPA: hypothetical protein VNK70_02535 [Candidatus Paceibacterota bacterium]|nr:hypothetical protein [Candidatus Paceibacterota bacterium]
MDYDSRKGFFVQWKELSDAVPRPNLEAYQNKNSSYSDYTWFSKNIYLSPTTISSDNVAYSKTVYGGRDVFDSTTVMNCEKVYHAIDSEHCVNCKFISDCKDCLDSAFLYDCRNSSDCFMSSNLRNKKFIFRNKQLNEDEYRRELSKITYDRENLARLLSEYLHMRKSVLHKHANIVKCLNSSGNNLFQCKNAVRCFNAESCEDVKYGVQMARAKDSHDVFGVGDKEAALLYEGVNVGYLDSNIYFSTNSFENCARVQYCDYCRGSQDLFGCIGLRKKQYCILNKQYDKETYLQLKNKISKEMSENPYFDSAGNFYKYGEFFPPEFSPFAYNEAMTQFYFPSKEGEFTLSGCQWAGEKKREYQPTKHPDEIPQSIKEVSDDILREVIECKHKGKCGHNCTIAFKIVPQELQLYRQMNIPIPILCPACRNEERQALRTPIKLWHRECMCDYKVYQNSSKHSHHPEERCPNEFETSYAPDRPEIVYCELCYNAEVV